LGRGAAVFAVGPLEIFDKEFASADAESHGGIVDTLVKDLEKVEKVGASAVAGVCGQIVLPGIPVALSGFHRVGTEFNALTAGTGGMSIELAVGIVSERELIAAFNIAPKSTWLLYNTCKNRARERTKRIKRLYD
jgi:hypothetical protein